MPIVVENHHNIAFTILFILIKIALCSFVSYLAMSEKLEPMPQ